MLSLFAGGGDSEFAWSKNKTDWNFQTAFAQILNREMTQQHCDWSITNRLADDLMT